MLEPHATPETDKLKAELLQMADRKAAIEAALDAMVWPEGEMRIDDTDEASKLRDLGFYGFWMPSSRHC